MNNNIRNHIINNFQNDDYDSLKKALDEAVKEQDEYNLPGLGVFLELIWENSNENLKNELIKIIKTSVEKRLINIDVNPK